MAGAAEAQANHSELDDRRAAPGPGQAGGPRPVTLTVLLSSRSCRGRRRAGPSWSRVG